MSTRFTVGARNPDIRYDLTQPQNYQPDLFIEGNSLTGFRPTVIPPELGFWGVTFRDKQINAATLESGNALTFVLNNVVDPLVPGEQRYVTAGAGSLMQEQATGRKSDDGWSALMGLGPAAAIASLTTKEVSDLDALLTFRDADFQAKDATEKFMANPDNRVLTGLVARHTGRDLEAVLSTARNRDHFMYLQRRELTQAQAMQNIVKFEDEAGFGLKWSSRVTSFVGNYLLTDPTFVPSLFIGAGAVNLSGRAITVGSNVTRLAAPVVGGQRALNAGRAAALVARSPAAAHRALSTHMGHRLALAVEMGAYGGAWDLAIQQQRLAESEILFDDPDHRMHFSWAELGLSVALGGTLSFGLSALGAGVNKAKEGLAHRSMRQASVEAAGGSPASPLGYSFDNLRAQSMMDGSAVRAQRAATTLLGDDFDSVAMYLDDDMLLSSGLNRFQIADALEEMVFATGGETLPPVAVHRVLSDMLAEAKRGRGLRQAVTEALPTQMEQAAFAEALSRAARDLPLDAPNSNVIERAVSHMDEELAKIEARMQARATQARPAGETELAYWRQEKDLLLAASQRRTLTEAETDYLGTVAGKLESLGETNPFKGWAQSTSKRYASGAIFAPFRAREGSDLTKALQRASKARREIQEIEAAKQGGFGKGTDTRDLKNARDRLRRAEKRVQQEGRKEADRVVTAVTEGKVAEITRELALNPPKTRAERFRALDDIANAVDFNVNALIEDGTMIGRLLGGWGMNGLRKIAQQGTGMDQTVRSTTGLIREIAHEFDPSKLRVGDLSPDRTNLVHRTLEDIRTDMAVRTSEILDEYKRLHDGGKFGSSVRVVRYQRARKDFDKSVIRHITGAVESTDPDVRGIAKIWQRHADEIGAIGKATGQFSRKLDNFFPRRWSISNILRNEGDFLNALARHFRAKWVGSDEVHLDTLVKMGFLRRAEGPDDPRPVWVRADNNEAVAEGLKRNQLKELFGVEDEAYLRAIDEVDAETGFTPMQESANRSKNRLTGDDTIEETASGKLITKRVGAAHSEASRAFEESVWTNPELADFLDWRFAHGASGYLRSSGFRVANTARHQQRWGVPGLKMDETLDWAESRLLKLDSTLQTEEKRLIRDGIKTLREKLHFAEGRLPTLRDQTNGLGEWLGDTGTSLAGALYGSGIGQAVLTTEVMQAMVSRVYNLDDVVRRVGDIFKVGLKTGDMRQQMQTLGLTVRQYRLHTLERLTGDAVYSEGFQFGLIPKLLAPWMDVFDNIVHGPGSLGRRVADAVPQGLRAHAATTMTVGQMDYFTQFSRMIHVQSMLDETGRFWIAAEKTAAALQKSGRVLDDVEIAAREAAEAAGKSAEKAQKAGTRARFKAWTGIARKNGFGGNWQVAERMQRAGLLNPERLALLRKAGVATNSLKDTGTFKTLDFNEMMKFTGGTANEQAQFSEAFRALRDMMVDTIHKRVSEQNILQAPTSKTSRTWLGRTQLAMTSFARSWYDNNILDTAQMPMRAAVGLITTYLIGETMNSIMRDLWKGRSIDETIADIDADRDNFVARSLTRLPLLGAWNSLAMPAADALTRDGRMQRVETGESAAEGAIGAATDLVYDSIHGSLSDDVDVQARTWRTAARLLPGYRTWYAGLIAQGAERAGVFDPSSLPGSNTGGARFRSGERVRGAIAPIPDFIEGEVQTGPKIPEDLSFLYPDQ